MKKKIQNSIAQAGLDLCVDHEAPQVLLVLTITQLVDCSLLK